MQNASNRKLKKKDDRKSSLGGRTAYYSERRAKVVPGTKINNYGGDARERRRALMI